MDEPEPHCACPDFETTQRKCKHIYAIESSARRETATDDDAEVAAIETDPKLTYIWITKPSYPQTWPAYHAAQTNEKSLFLRLLSGPCSYVESPVQTMGRPRLSVADQLFCTTYKVFSTVSCCRVISDLDEARENGHLERGPHFNSVPFSPHTLYEICWFSRTSTSKRYHVFVPLVDRQLSFAFPFKADGATRFSRRRCSCLVGRLVRRFPVTYFFEQRLYLSAQRSATVGSKLATRPQ